LDPLQLFAYVFILVLGLVVGSFLNVVIYRYTTGESMVRPRSRCTSCGTFLRLWDLVPLFSFLLLGGKCRYCGEKLSARYPLVEAASGAIFLTCFHYLGVGPFFWKYIVLFSLLLVVSCIDLEKQIIPNRFVLLIFTWILLWQFVYPELTALSAVIGFFIGGVLFYIIAVLSKGGMGGGDVKLMAALGFAAGLPLVFFIFLLSFIGGAAVGILLMALKKKGRKSPLPFGPFLAAAFFIVTFWGEQIWNWYFSFL